MKLLKPLLLAVLAATSLGASAKYNGEDRGRPVLPAHVDAKWQAECSSCHLAYPPGLLPAASWKKVMSGLNQHFGTDASLSSQDTQEITAFLEKNASNRWSANSAPLRITDSQWFKSKHREMGAAIWQRVAIKSPGNCSACHSGAGKGDFDEDRVHIPK